MNPGHVSVLLDQLSSPRFKPPVSDNVFEADEVLVTQVDEARSKMRDSPMDTLRGLRDAKLLKYRSPVRIHQKSVHLDLWHTSFKKKNTELNHVAIK